MTDPENPEVEAQSDVPGAFGHYWQYAKLWRMWVVGTAAAALFILLNKDVGANFDCRATVSVFFILAAGLQVFLAWINKTGAFYEYRRESLSEKGDSISRWVRFWCWVSDRYCIDFSLNLVSLGLVVYAVYIMATEILSK